MTSVLELPLPVKIEAQEDGLAKPLHVQRLEKALELGPFLNYVQNILDKNGHGELCSDEEEFGDDHGMYNGVNIPKSERRADKARYYQLSRVKKGRKWLKNLLLSDSSSEEEAGPEIHITEADIRSMLRHHVREKKTRHNYYNNPELQQYQYYSTGLLSNYDKYSEKSVIANKAKREQRKRERKLMRARMKQMRQEEETDSDDDLPPNKDYVQFRLLTPSGEGMGRGRVPKRDRKLSMEQMGMRRRKIFSAIAKKEIPKAHKQMASGRKDMLAQLKKVAKESQKEARKQALLSQKHAREAQIRARRLSKEMMVYWKRFEKVEKEQRKRAEREAQAQRKEDLEVKEMKRQQRKLNFLITQTELYAHFMARKMTGEDEEEEEDRTQETILKRLEEDIPGAGSDKNSRALVDMVADDYDAEAARVRAVENAERAYNAHQQHKDAFDHVTRDESTLAHPAISTDAERPQPSIFEGTLKGYQLKGMNWLANLYDQGINGILADEMGLGKTVQSIALLAHLAETQGIWGPTLVVAPASTLHNWQQEVTRFLPKFKVVPYWGNTQDRKILRKFWNSDAAYTEEASFHVVITSYQLVIQDVKYFSRIKWHYMILDEAQAIKSSTSVRWKILLGFNCRNRLLLTGTPIQNTMQELWALLHFIMPTMFDSHEEFNEWFSKDIESHAERQSGIDEKHLSRLHMILKPFMLRRCKTEVQNELSDKIEVLVHCPLTARQKLLYRAVKNKIRMEDLLQSGSSSSTSTSSLMNLVMQFRKVCNHPELFERKEIRSPFYMRLPTYCIPKLVYRASLLDDSIPSQRHLLFNRFYIHNPHNVHSSIFHQDLATEEDKAMGDNRIHCRSCFSFTRLTNLSPADLHAFMLKGLLVRWLAQFAWAAEARQVQHEVTWQPESARLHRRPLLLEPRRTTHFSALQSSPHLQKLVFTSPTRSFHAHLPWTLHCMPETIAHRKIRLRRLSGRGESAPGKPKVVPPPPPRSPHKLPQSPTKLLHSEDEHGPVFSHMTREPVTFDDVASDVPVFLFHIMPKVLGQPFTCFTSDRSAAWRALADRLGGHPHALPSLLHGTSELSMRTAAPRTFTAQPRAGFAAVTPKYGYSGVYVPDKETLVRDAGKLYVLDSLLSRLKKEGHRVLVYSQMTRMIDILEEYMWHRKHTYIRLDGSSKISDRRDMVADFQSRSDIFAFLLSTRAGGLGINLTAADTVIFYDSDWNPTVDQQAMDRAHRLGQTKQVTVYRLICKGTIEERILQRAKEKSEIQKMVISGGDYRPDVLRPKEVVSLLLDDTEMHSKFSQKTDEDRLLGSRPHFSMGIKRKPTVPGKKGPGRPKKKKEENVTIAEESLPRTSSQSLLDTLSSASQPASPLSTVSQDGDTLVADESSMDTPTPPPSSTAVPPSSGQRGGGGAVRKRGRPKGSVSGSRRPRGRGSIQKALHAAEAAAAQAGLSKGYAAYGYSMQGSASSGSVSTSASPTSASISPVRGSSPRGRGRPPSRQAFTPKRSPKTPQS